MTSDKMTHKCLRKHISSIAVKKNLIKSVPSTHMHVQVCILLCTVQDIQKDMKMECLLNFVADFHTVGHGSVHDSDMCGHHAPMKDLQQQTSSKQVAEISVNMMIELLQDIQPLLALAVFFCMCIDPS